eukprot:m.179869 g.179869  ORF g.179869 m.179869 type:complete len:570 (+) comp39233_c0_seq5:207-1916(+)
MASHFSSSRKGLALHSFLGLLMIYMRISCTVAERRKEAFARIRQSSVVFLCPTRNPIFWENDKSEVINSDIEDRAFLFGNRLRVSFLRASDTGLYKCRDSESHKVIKEFNLTVVDPVLHVEQSNVYVTEGDSIQLVCIRRAQSLFVLWYRENKMILTRGRFAKYQDGNRSILKIANVQKNDSGMYMCQANLRVGVIQNSTTVWVGKAPTIIRPFTANIIQQVGKEVKVKCNTTGDSDKVSWMNNKSAALFSDSETLYIPKIQGTHAGKYTCVVENEFGKDVETLSIIVVQGVSAPMNVSILYDCSWGFTSTWIAPETSPDYLYPDSYNVLVMMYNTTTTSSNSTLSTVKNFTVTGLKGDYPEYYQAGLCTSPVVYIVEVQGVSLAHRVEGTRVRANSVKNIEENSKFLKAETLFPMKPPCFQVDLIKISSNCKSCRQNRTFSGAATLKKIFQNQLNAMSTGVILSDESQFTIDGRRRKALRILIDVPLQIQPSINQILQLESILQQWPWNDPLLVGNCKYHVFCKTLHWENTTNSCANILPEIKRCRTIALYERLGRLKRMKYIVMRGL